MAPLSFAEILTHPVARECDKRCDALEAQHARGEISSEKLKVYTSHPQMNSPSEMKTYGQLEAEGFFDNLLAEVNGVFN